MGINEKINGDKLLSEQQKLVDQQTTELEKLEGQQSEDLRRLNLEAQEERSKEEQDIVLNNQQQKQLVGGQARIASREKMFTIFKKKTVNAGNYFPYYWVTRSRNNWYMEEFTRERKNYFVKKIAEQEKL